MKDECGGLRAESVHGPQWSRRRVESTPEGSQPIAGGRAQRYHRFTSLTRSHPGGMAEEPLATCDWGDKDDAPREPTRVTSGIPPGCEHERWTVNRWCRCAQPPANF